MDDSLYQYDKMKFHWSEFIMPEGYELSPIGSKYADSAAFTTVTKGSRDIGSFIKICYAGNEIIGRDWFPCIRKKKEIVDNGKPFMVSFAIKK